MNIRAWLIIAAGFLFVISVSGFLLVKLFLRPKEDSDLDHYHWEFEETHPELKQYLLWSRIFFAGVIVSMLLLFIAISV